MIGSEYLVNALFIATISMCGDEVGGGGGLPIKNAKVSALNFGLGGGGGGVVSFVKSPVKAREGVVNGGTGTGGLPSFNINSLARGEIGGGGGGGGGSLPTKNSKVSVLSFGLGDVGGGGGGNGGPRVSM